MKNSQKQQEEIERKEDSQMTTNRDDPQHKHPPVGVPPTHGDSDKDVEQRNIHHQEGGPPQVKSEGRPPQVKSEGGPPQVQFEGGPPVKSKGGPPRVQSEGGPPQMKSEGGPPRVQSEGGPPGVQSEASAHQSVLSQSPGSSQDTHAHRPNNQPQAHIKAPAHLLAQARSHSPEVKSHDPGHLTHGQPQDRGHPPQMHSQTPDQSTQPMYTQAPGHLTELPRPQSSPPPQQHMHPPHNQGNPGQGHPQVPNYQAQVRPPALAPQCPPHWQHQAPYYPAQHHPQMNGYHPQANPPPPMYSPRNYPQPPVYPQAQAQAQAQARGYLPPMQMVIVTTETKPERSGNSVWIASGCATFCLCGTFFILLPLYV